MPRLNPETGLKKCTKCEEEKTAEFYFKHSQSKDGLNPRCREFCSEDWGGKFRRPRERLNPETGLKKCFGCKEHKSSENFGKKSDSFDGLNSECRICVRKRGRAHWQANKEAYSEKQKLYRSDPDVRERERKWHQEWEKKNKDKRSILRMNRRARINNAYIEDVIPSVIFERDSGICQICFTAIEDDNWHIDHRIPLVKGGEHSYANTQLSHAFCNLSKGAKILEDSEQS